MRTNHTVSWNPPAMLVQIKQYAKCEIGLMAEKCDVGSLKSLYVTWLPARKGERVRSTKCPFLARSCHPISAAQCLTLREERTSCERLATSHFDPTATFNIDFFAMHDLHASGRVQRSAKGPARTHDV
jgi:hypothetical protein